MHRLTPKEREAVLAVLNERIAGGAEPLREALGLKTVRQGERMIGLLRAALDKIGE